MSPQPVTDADRDLVESLFERISADLGMIIDHPLTFEGVEAERLDHRPAGEGEVHVSFRVELTLQGQTGQGSFLLPARHAITAGGYLMMATDEEVERWRERDEIDASMKEAILEVSNFVAGSIESVLRRVAPGEVSVRSGGCQGVRADVRPAFQYEEGTELLVGRAQGSLEGYEPCTAMLMLPVPPQTGE